MSETTTTTTTTTTTAAPEVALGERVSCRERGQWHLWIGRAKDGQCEIGLSWPIMGRRGYDDEDALSHNCGCDFGGRSAHAHMVRRGTGSAIEKYRRMYVQLKAEVQAHPLNLARIAQAHGLHE